jgi:hypothetical protein
MREPVEHYHYVPSKDVGIVIVVAS